MKNGLLCNIHLGCFLKDFHFRRFTLRALRTIEEGEEILISYRDNTVRAITSGNARSFLIRHIVFSRSAFGTLDPIFSNGNFVLPYNTGTDEQCCEP